MTLTNEQKAIIDNERTVKYVRLEFPNTQIDDIEYDKIYQESMSLEESLFDGDNLTFGKCNASLFKVKVADFLDDINNLDMNVYITFTHEDLGSVAVPFGKYKVMSAERTSDKRHRDITAIDYMSKFDVDVSDWYNNVMFLNNQSTYTLKAFREALCDYIGVDYESVTLPNDNTVIKKTIEANSLMGRELLEMICELNGCFGHFDWEGMLNFIALDPESSLERIDTYPQNGSDYKDYEKNVCSGVILKDENGNELAHYPYNVGSYPYAIENNALTFSMIEFDAEWVCQNLYNAIKYVAYRSNTTKVFSKIYMPLGQRYRVIAKTYVGSEEIDTSFNSFILKRQIQGIQAIFSNLEAPEITDTKTSNIISDIKALQNKLNVVQSDVDNLSNKIQLYTIYENETSVSVDTNGEIINIGFKTSKKSFMEFSASVTFILETESSESNDIEIFNDGKVEFEFILNDIPVLDYKPKVTYQDGTYTIHLDYSYFNEITSRNLNQTFVVKCYVTDCEILIPIKKIHAFLTGDGLYIGGSNDTLIEASDEFENIELNMIPELTESASITVRNETMLAKTETLNIVSLDGIVPRITDSVGTMLGMIFNTNVNTNMLTYTATILNDEFISGVVITPKIHNITSVNVISRGDVSYVASFDNGTTWKEYANGQWIEGSTMTKAEIEAVPTSAWVGDVMIKAIIADDNISSLSQIIAQGGTLV